MQSQLSVYNELIFKQSTDIKVFSYNTIPSSNQDWSALYSFPLWIPYNVIHAISLHGGNSNSTKWYWKNQVEMTAYWSDPGFEKKKIQVSGWMINI